MKLERPTSPSWGERLFGVLLLAGLCVGTLALIWAALFIPPVPLNFVTFGAAVYIWVSIAPLAFRDVLGSIWYGDSLWDHPKYSTREKYVKAREEEEKQNAMPKLPVVPAQASTSVTIPASLVTGATGAVMPPGPNPLPSGPLEDLGLAIEPIIGIRHFGVHYDHTLGEHRIFSSFGQFVWTPMQPFEAVCGANATPMYTDLINHDAPYEGCHCGIYAWTPGQWGSQATGIWGEVYLWGNVLIAERGYRAEYAYPKSLNITGMAPKASRRAAADIEARYGIPVEVRDIP